MNFASLAARYRPRTFAEVAGQEVVRTVLSRAAAAQRAAPAYLFSGTRGVGKTTIARIFAKALNCERGPGPEPCNECPSCIAVARGSSPDVVEIDGASNRGIEDAKRLKETVGYAPLEGRYKVFIIDEAHMLTREAFNALLKTLEEPPARVTFLLATTEPHKFPPTIISRCQHFVFRRLGQGALEAHLSGVLEREGVDFEREAVAVLARRAGGSVRDAMSLLGQTLALSQERLTAAAVREVLGLAGSDLYFELLGAIRAQDCVGVSRLVRQLLDQGVDIGFFLRELGEMWRNLFILSQAAEEGLAAIDVPEAEGRELLAQAGALSASHIHACWQMTLESQRRILSAAEPAQALELLLLNLALLPRLLPIEELAPPDSRQPNHLPQPAAGENRAAPSFSQPAGQGRPPGAPQRPARQNPGNDPEKTAHAPSSSSAPAGAAGPADRAASPPSPPKAEARPAKSPREASPSGEKETASADGGEPEPVASGAASPEPEARVSTGVAAAHPAAKAAPDRTGAPASPPASEKAAPADRAAGNGGEAGEEDEGDDEVFAKTWTSIYDPEYLRAVRRQRKARAEAQARGRKLTRAEKRFFAFREFCAPRGSREALRVLALATPFWEGESRLRLQAASRYHEEELADPAFQEWALAAFRDYTGQPEASIEWLPPRVRRDREELKKEILSLEATQRLIREFDATLVDFWEK